MISMLARNWWAFLARGILAILFGLIALFTPGVTMFSLVLVFAASVSKARLEAAQTARTDFDFAAAAREQLPACREFHHQKFRWARPVADREIPKADSAQT